MKPFTSATVVVLLVVALMHLLRVVLGWDIIVGGIFIPVWASVVACVLAAALAFMLRRESRT